MFFPYKNCARIAVVELHFSFVSVGGAGGGGGGGWRPGGRNRINAYET